MTEICAYCILSASSDAQMQVLLQMPGVPRPILEQPPMEIWRNLPKLASDFGTYALGWMPSEHAFELFRWFEARHPEVSFVIGHQDRIRPWNTVMFQGARVCMHHLDFIRPRRGR